MDTHTHTIYDALKYCIVPFSYRYLFYLLSSYGEVRYIANAVWESLVEK